MFWCGLLLDAVVRFRNPRAPVLQVLCGNRLGTASPGEDSFGVNVSQNCCNVGIHCQYIDGCKTGKSMFCCMCCGSLQSSIDTDWVWTGAISWSFHRVLESKLGFVARWLFYECSLVFNRRETMKSRSFWLSLVLLGVFPSVTRGWMDVDRSRRLYSDAGRLHQEVLYTSCCCGCNSCLFIFVLCLGSAYRANRKQVRAYPCVFVLNTCWGGQWRNSEAEALTLFEYAAIVLGGKLCIWPLWRCCLCSKFFTARAAGTNETKFNKQTSSWLFIWVTGPSGETWKKSFCCIKKGKLSHRWF